ncbi:MAG: tyrosine-type recombinase/integrase [Acidimicrobiales bacterium]
MTKSALGSIRKGGSGRYQLRVSVRGRQVGIGAFDTRREAVAALAQHAATANARVDRQAGRGKVSEFVEVWWSERGGHRASTRVRDRQALDRDIIPFFGAMPLGRLERADAQEWVDGLSSRMAPATVRRTFTILDQLLASAVGREVIAVNPAKGVRLPRVVTPEARFLTPTELALLVDTIDSRYRAMVLVQAWATLRIGEATGLRRLDVDLVAGTLRVENNVVQVGGRLVEGPPKTKAGRRKMTMPASVMTELAEHLDRQPGSTYLFGPRGERPMYASDYRRSYWRRAVEDAGLSPLRPHDLKHTGVAFLAAAGVDPSEIARRAGHTSVAFTYDT